MYSIEPFEFTMACIVLIGYISGKLWMYYSIEDKDTKPNKSKRIKSGRKSRVIKRGPEWPE
jgi:hypothetical protein